MRIENEIKIERKEFLKLNDLDYGTVFVFADDPSVFYLWVDIDHYIDLENGATHEPYDEERWKEVREVKCTLKIESIE